MEKRPGRHCAALLVAMDLPFATMVECLMGELDLTYDEAQTALHTARSIVPGRRRLLAGR